MSHLLTLPSIKFRRKKKYDFSVEHTLLLLSFIVAGLQPQSYRGLAARRPRPLPMTTNARIEAVKKKLENSTKSDKLSEVDFSALGKGGFKEAVASTYVSYGGKSPTRRRNWVTAVLEASLIGRGDREAAVRLRAEQARPALPEWLESLRRAPRETFEAAMLLLCNPAPRTPMHIIVGDHVNANSSWLEATVRFARKFGLSVDACAFASPGDLNATNIIHLATRGIRVVETLDPSSMLDSVELEAGRKRDAVGLLIYPIGVSVRQAAEQHEQELRGRRFAILRVRPRPRNERGRFRKAVVECTFQRLLLRL